MDENEKIWWRTARDNQQAIIGKLDEILDLLRASQKKGTSDEFEANEECRGGYNANE